MNLDPKRTLFNNGNIQENYPNLSIDVIREFINGIKSKKSVIDSLIESESIGNCCAMYDLYVCIRAHIEIGALPFVNGDGVYLSMSKNMDKISIMCGGDCMKITRDEVLEWIK